jgi:hypothetical protein
MADMFSITKSDITAHLEKTKWIPRVRDEATRVSFWEKFMGAEGSRMPIIRKTDLSIGDGTGKIKITTISKLKNKGVRDGNTLKGNEGLRKTGQIEVTVGFVRNAEAATKEAEFFSLYKRLETSAEALGDWAGLEKDADLFSEFLTTGTPDVVYGGSAHAESELVSSSSLGALELTNMKTILKRKRSLPFKVKNKNGFIEEYYGVVLDDLLFEGLKTDITYDKAMTDVVARGETNPIFTGAPHIYNGMIIYPYSMVGGDQGSALRPESRLYAAHSDTVSTLYLGLAADKVEYTKFFTSTGTLSIVNSDGEKEFIDYTGKTDYSFTGCSRGATYGLSSADGARAYIGDEIITQSNFLSQVVAFGAEAMVRAIGQEIQPKLELDDYEFVKGVGIEMVYGQGVVKDVAGKNPNYVVGKFYSENPNRNA